MNKDIVDLIDGMESSATLEDSWAVFLRFSKKFGFDNLIYGAMSIERPDHAPLQIHSLENKWIDYYQSEKYYESDIVIDHVLASVKPFKYYTDVLIDDDALDASRRRVIVDAADAGLKNILAFPTRPHGYYSHGNISYINDENIKDVETRYEQYAEILGLASVYTDMFFNRFLNGNDLPRIHLSVRQKEILKWLCAGKSYKQIACKLNLSYQGIVYHINKLKLTLNVTTTSELIAKSMSLKIIDL